MTDDRPSNEGISFDKQQADPMTAGGPPDADHPTRPTDHVPTGYGPAAHGPGGYAPGGYGPPAPGPAGYGPTGYGPAGYGGYPGYPAYGFRPGPPPGPKPSNNIGWAIASVILFWPLCIPAFMASARVEGAWFAGDYIGAKKASDDAKKFGMIGVIIGASMIALYFVFIVIVFGVVIGTASHVHPSYVVPS